MNRAVKASVALALATGSIVGLASPASAATTQMRNNPTYYNDGYCWGNVVMSNFYTDSSSISSATYYDQYQLNNGTWQNAATSVTLNDSDTNDYTMITGLSERRVRVRANHYVTTVQGNTAAGSSCLT